jgi:hypothetical protein
MSGEDFGFVILVIVVLGFFGLFYCLTDNVVGVEAISLSIAVLVIWYSLKSGVKYA